MSQKSVIFFTSQVISREKSQKSIVDSLNFHSPDKTPMIRAPTLLRIMRRGDWGMKRFLAKVHAPRRQLVGAPTDQATSLYRQQNGAEPVEYSLLRDIRIHEPVAERLGLAVTCVCDGHIKDRPTTRTHDRRATAGNHYS